jgi:ligand-binding sensor domain-containing protein
MKRAFVSLATCAALVGCQPTSPGPKAPTTTRGAYRGSRIVSFTDTYSISGVVDGGPALWASTNQGLLRWDLQQGKYGVFTAKDGLPAGKLLALTIDREGAVWVATAKGVARGTRTGWKTFPPAPVGEFIAGMVASPDRDEIWAAGPGGLARLRGNAWSHYFDETPITAIAMQPNGALWLGTTGRGVLRIPRTGDRVEQYGQPEGCEPDLVRAIAAGPDWVLVVGENDRGARAALFDGNRFWSYSLASGGAGTPIEWAARGGKEVYVGKEQSFFRIVRGAVPADATEAALQFTPIGKLAAQARMVPLSDGVSSKVLETLERLAPTPAPPPRTEPGDKPPSPPGGPGLWALQQNQRLPEGVTTVSSGDRGVLVGTRFRGIVRIENGLLRPFQTADLAAGADRITVACTKGESDECYLATGAQRAWHFDGQSFSVAQIDPEPGSRVLAVLRDSQGAVLALHRGAKDSVLRVSRVDEGRWTPIGMTGVAVPVGAPDLNFASFAPNGNLWVGLRYTDTEGEIVDFGAAELNVLTGEAKYHRLDPAIPAPQQLPNNVVALTWRGEDEGWFATRSGAVRVEGGKTTVYTENEGLESEIIHDIETAPGGEVWVATRRGTGRFDGRRWRFPKLGAFYLPSNALARDDAGHTFLGTDKGLYCFGPCSDDVIDQKHGLLEDNVRDLAVDAHHRVWALTKKGISIVEP